MLPCTDHIQISDGDGGRASAGNNGGLPKLLTLTPPVLTELALSFGLANELLLDDGRYSYTVCPPPRDRGDALIE